MHGNRKIKQSFSLIWLKVSDCGTQLKQHEINFNEFASRARLENCFDFNYWIIIPLTFELNRGRLLIVDNQFELGSIELRAQFRDFSMRSLSGI